jgi:integrase
MKGFKMGIDLMGYVPNVSIFEYKKKSSCKFWMNYVLPNQKRVRRPCGNLKATATRTARIKQGQLVNGQFDEYDRKKLGKLLKTEQKLTLEEAKVLYLEITSNNKQKRTLKRDEYLLNVAFGFFKDRGLMKLNDIFPLDCVRLISHLKEKGLKKSSIKNYRMTISKLFNQLRKMKLTNLENPMTDVEIPKEGKFDRDRIPSNKEIKSIVTELSKKNHHSSNSTPTGSIIRFALYTGARVGEILHAEWHDFDLESGIWYLKNKPECPGVEGIGWSPKWRKERIIKLFPEALSILLNMPKRETVGHVEDSSGNKIAIKGNFVFPKKQVRIEKNCPMQSKKGHYKCCKCREIADKEACDFRTVVYSRCNSIKTAWSTVREKTGIKDLNIHDFRRFFNRVILQERLNFSPEEAGRYIGNSRQVNLAHYSPISAETLERKINQRTFNELINAF